MKKVALILSFILMFTTFVCARVNYVEVVGEYILKIQGVLMGIISFVGLGLFRDGQIVGFAQFLFIALMFMLIYSLITFTPFISEGLQFPISLVISILAFLYIDSATIEMLLTNYEAMGVVITIFIPILILLAFTFRIYYKAHVGESERSPFYAKLFNMIFLIFFGIFFIRYSLSEEGIIGTARFLCGWGLIIFGVAQFFLLYRIFANVIDKARSDYQKEKREEKRRISKQAEEIDRIKVEAFE